MKSRKKIYTLLMVMVLGTTLAACGTQKADTKNMEDTVSKSEMEDKEDMNGKKKILESMKGMFQGENNLEVSGNVEIKNNILMLSDFATAEGPDVHVWLVKGDDISTGFDISKIDLKDKSQQFDISKAPMSDYDTVLIYCNDAHKVFGRAKLNSM